MHQNPRNLTSGRIVSSTHPALFVYAVSTSPHDCHVPHPCITFCCKNSRYSSWTPKSLSLVICINLRNSKRQVRADVRISITLYSAAAANRGNVLKSAVRTAIGAAGFLEAMPLIVTTVCRRCTPRRPPSTRTVCRHDKRGCQVMRCGSPALG